MNDIFKTVTTEQFKEYFFRDFPFLPLYKEGKVYWTDDVVYYNEFFYKSLIDNNTSLPTDTEAWEVTKDDVFNYVTDADIQKAMSQAIINANERFGYTNEEKINIYLHLIAFYLVVDLKNASAGVNSTYAGLVASKSVDGVSVSYNFPQWMMNNPLYSIYNQNGYGMKYLSLILPYLSITILFSPGRTTYG
nr:MAG TPA: head to tail adaptor [Caudoviricetes sp.]